MRILCFLLAIASANWIGIQAELVSPGRALWLTSGALAFSVGFHMLRWMRRL